MEYRHKRHINSSNPRSITAMEAEVTYKLSSADLRKVLSDELAELSKSAVLGQFSGRLISADTAAEIHGVHRDTILRYAKAGIIECQHTGKLWKFQLSYILGINMHDLKKKI